MPHRPASNESPASEIAAFASRIHRHPLPAAKGFGESNEPPHRKSNFYHQRDGKWIRGIAHGTSRKCVVEDVVFKTPGEALQWMARHFGKSAPHDAGPANGAAESSMTAAASEGLPADSSLAFLARRRAEER